jgi:hypothetical protein
MLNSPLMTHVTLLSVSLRVVHWRGSSDLRTVESFVHTSLDLYAFIALTPSSSTVNGLIKMVRSDNDRRQEEMDRRGNAGHRSLDVRICVVTIWFLIFSLEIVPCLQLHQSRI